MPRIKHIWIKHAFISLRRIIQSYLLQDLYDSLDKMIRLSITNQALSQDQIEKLIDGSLMILDLCNVAKDALSHMKEGLKDIQSILRRKRGDLSPEVKKYLATRKSLKKSFQKVLKNLGP
ncbi:hypothetical protein Rs2_12872 [Raphanus sativus]|nr:hypothetical protein Rs2_12872 [Raphanus sativus]